jgi:hypothetical protein
MNWTKEWQRRGHKVVQSGIQYGIGAANALIGPEGISGTGIGARTVTGVVGGLGAAMGSDFAADAMWAAIGSGCEAAGEATVNFWRKNKRPEGSAIAGAEAPKQATAPAQQTAPAPVGVAIPDEMFRALLAQRFAEMSPAERQKLIADVEAREKGSTQEEAPARTSAPALRPTG